MTLSDAGLDLIKTSEGFSSTVYKDVAGHPTIGYGHLIKSGESFPNGITDTEATALLETDVSTAEKAVGSLVKVPLTQGMYDALVDFTYNLGSGALAGSTLLKLLNTCQYSAACHQLLLWDYAGGKVVAGLKTRREAEVKLWTS